MSVRVQEADFDLNAEILRLRQTNPKIGAVASFIGVCRDLNDGDTVTVGDAVLKVIHCPGHTPGHVVFLHEPNQIAWVGDVIFAGSIGRSDFPQGNHDQLVSSIRNKLFPLGDDIQFIPGHGPNSTFGRERATNPFVADEVYG